MYEIKKSSSRRARMAQYDNNVYVATVNGTFTTLAKSIVPAII